MGAALRLMAQCMREPTARTMDMSMMLGMLVAFPQCLDTPLDMESTMAITSSATTCFLMGAISSLVAVLLLVPMLSIVGLSTMVTYLITLELCMASLLHSCLVLALLGAVLMLRLVVMLSWATVLVLLLKPILMTKLRATILPISP